MTAQEPPDRESAVQHFRELGAYISDHTGRVFGIQLRGCAADDSDLAVMRALRSELTVIGMGGTHVTDDGLRHLLDMPRLDNVDLTDTAITDAGLQLLARIKTLEFVHIEGTPTTRAGVEMLQRALPECEIVWDDEL